MINKETIISSFDDKSTLLKWLKKVEDALKNASAVSFNVNKRGDATLTFSIVFDDGSTIESNPIVLRQGESVESAAIVNGHLILTLTNGDELDAGALFSGNVSISGNLAVTGTISGKTPFLNADEEQITAQKPVVEVMTGYSAVVGSDNNFTYEPIYFGACKNGNKLTLVVALNLTKNAGAGNNPILGEIRFPSEIASKLFPTQVGSYNFLDNRILTAFATNYTYVQGPAYITKGTNKAIFVMNTANLIEETKYYIRYEATFLLSENLAA